MKNKKLLFVLLPAVILVWGLIIQKFMESSNQNIVVAYSGTIPMQTNQISKDTFQLILNYKDPFLGYIASPKKKLAIKNKIIKETPWPEIKYRGMIKKNSTKSELGIVEIDGESFILKKNGEEKGVKIRKMNKESAVFQFKGKKKVIQKE